MSSDKTTDLASRFTISRRHAIIGGVLLGAAAIAGARQPELRYPAVDADKFRSWIPEQFAGWQNSGIGDVVMPPPDSLSDRLYDNLVARTYIKPDGEQMMVLLAYNNIQDGMLQVHRPEVCYPVGGYTLTNTRPTELELGNTAIPSSYFTATSEDRTEHVLYFTRLGSRFPRTWAQQRAVVVESNLRGYIPDGMMLRVSSVSRDASQAFDDMRRFAQQFFQASSTPLQKLLAG